MGEIWKRVQFYQLIESIDMFSREFGMKQNQQCYLLG